MIFTRLLIMHKLISTNGSLLRKIKNVQKKLLNFLMQNLNNYNQLVQEESVMFTRITKRCKQSML